MSNASTFKRYASNLHTLQIEISIWATKKLLEKMARRSEVGSFHSEKSTLTQAKSNQISVWIFDLMNRFKEPNFIILSLCSQFYNWNDILKSFLLPCIISIKCARWKLKFSLLHKCSQVVKTSKVSKQGDQMKFFYGRVLQQSNNNERWWSLKSSQNTLSKSKWIHLTT